jgi:hypothetical protein
MIPFRTVLGAAEKSMSIGDSGYYGATLINATSFRFGLDVCILLGVPWHRGSHSILLIFCREAEHLPLK